jgi:hypothetical protein
MGSPFKGAEDYLAATGTIDSFTGHPLSATIALVLSAALTVYFLYAAYKIKHSGK